MSRSMLILVSENQETIERAKGQAQHMECSFHAYSPAQWNEGLESAFFRQQLTQEGAALAKGTNNVQYTGNVVPFPGSNVSSDSQVEKMEDMEAKAIENAIQQYRGNLTEAAKALGLGRATLYRKVKRYNIDPSASRKRKVAA